MLNEINGISIALSKKCFLVCKGCYNCFGKNNDVSSNTILDFLKEAWKKGARKVTFCGGDPLTRKDIIFILQETKKIGFHINLDTVGSPIIGHAKIIFHGNGNIPPINVQKLISYVDMIGIPIDGSTNEVIKHFRTGIPDIFDQQIRILNVLEKFQVNVCVNTVVHKKNIKDLPNLVSMLTSYQSIKKWQFFQFMPIGPLGFRNRELFEVDDTTFDVFSIKMQKLLHSNKFSGIPQFKSRAMRKNAYLLVDSDGIAYKPKFDKGNCWNSRNDASTDRVLIGNINNKLQVPAILENFSFVY